MRWDCFTKVVGKYRTAKCVTKIKEVENEGFTTVCTGNGFSVNMMDHASREGSSCKAW